MTTNNMSFLPNEEYEHGTETDIYFPYQKRYENGETFYRITDCDEFKKKVKKDKKRLDDMMVVAFNCGSIDYNIWTLKELRIRKSKTADL